MATETAQVLKALERLTELATMVEATPELRPILQKILGDGTVPVRARRNTRMTAERRKQMSLAAKRRWKLAKAQGKNTIGGGK